jgi:outer membrane protein OmpA-like peptidoglycan-associated protein
LTRRGAGESQATLGDPVPAKLIFHVALFKRIRGATAEKTLKLATLEGTIALLGRSRVPVFINGKGDDGGPNTLQYEDPALSGTGNGDASAQGSDEDSADTGDAAQNDSAASEGDDSAESASAASPPRMLELEFDSASFKGVDDGEGHNSRLLLPDEVNAFHYLELDTELEINGSQEQALGVADRLDVALTRLAPSFAPAFIVQLFDEVGEPLDGVLLSFKRGEQTIQRTTDADGVARLLALDDDPASVTLVDPDALRDTLRERWDKPRGKPLAELGPDVKVLEPRHFDETLTVTPDKPLVICVRPRVILARLLSMFFDKNKSFLLPSVMPTIAELKKLYDDNPDTDLLVVGHADTTAGDRVNDPLSLQRADMVAAFLKDNVEPWLAQYSASSEAQRWGAIEDALMIQSLPDFGTKPPTEDNVSWFQRTRGLERTDKGGKAMRSQLIGEYMALDQASLPADIPLVTHGAGKHFPLDASGQNLDAAPPNNSADPLDRRVELFFFEKEFGIQPPPPGKNSSAGSPEYPEWRLRASQIEQFDGTLPRLLRLRVLINGQLMANTPVQLFVDGVLASSVPTDANGFIEIPIAASAQSAVLEIPSRKIRQPISIVDPNVFPNINTLRGVQQRLAQLGFFAGVVDGRPSADTDEAVQSFKSQNGLGSDSRIDESTRRKLVEVYGS